jgi:hypothetical protein
VRAGSARQDIPKYGPDEEADTTRTGLTGNRRSDFDFVIAAPGERLARMMALLYDRGLELVSRMSDEGDVISTIASRRVAAVRVRLDAPASAYFCNPETGLRIDLLFDFPIPAAELADRANRLTIHRYAFSIASDEDLLRLKKIAKAARSAPGDAEDIAFLESRRARDR